MVEKLLIKEATRDSNTVKVAIVEVVPFTEGDFNLVQGCQDVGAAEDDDNVVNRSDIDLLKGSQDTNAIL